MTRHHLFKLLGAWLSVLIFTNDADAVEIKIESPDPAQTDVYSSITKRILRWRDKEKVLVAEVTFSTARYADAGERAEEETYEFRLPGVEFDAPQQTYFVRAANGEAIAVAKRTPQLIGSRIDLLPAAIIRVIRQKGNVQVVLQADSKAPWLPPQPVLKPDGTQEVPLQSVLGH